MGVEIASGSLLRERRRDFMVVEGGGRLVCAELELKHTQSNVERTQSLQSPFFIAPPTKGDEPSRPVLKLNLHTFSRAHR